MALKKDLNSGIIFAPYIMAQTTTPYLDDKYDAFKKAYKEKHKYCPKCGSQNHSITLVDYIVNMSKLDEFKDLNRCECTDCGNIHIVHERISNIELREMKLKELKIK